MAPSAISSPESHAQSSNGPLNGQMAALDLSSSNNNNSHELLDLLCVGFGPASLAIAIATHDYHSQSSSTPAPKVQFLEKQHQFAWHAGMQLPGAKMQISFMKDLATPRDPRSKFTFINYLFEKGRLNHFINLGTFLPTRAEYEDYLRWCASHFEKEGKVAYGMEVEGVRVGSKSADGTVTSFAVTARSSNGSLITRRARHVVIAVGGRPVMPPVLQGLKNVSHSSQSASTIRRIQEVDAGRKLRFAVVGSGQSAAEIFNDLGERFPDASVKLVIRGASLRPSDDSPFVNEIFDPDRVDGIYAQDPSIRESAIALDRGTNYGVVRLSLLEHLYEKLYIQRLHNPDPSTWRCQILNQRSVVSASQATGKDQAITLRLARTTGGEVVGGGDEEEELDVDYVFAATGYRRNAHEEMLGELKGMLEDGEESRFPVGRDYRVRWAQRRVDERAGVWLQGCNEGTHGLSDTLLSILAVRGGELVQSIFGAEAASQPTTSS